MKQDKKLKSDSASMCVCVCVCERIKHCDQLRLTGDLEGIRLGWGKSKNIIFKERSLVWLKNITMAGVA